MNRRKIGLYILFSFGFSWAVALVMRLAHVELMSLMGRVLVAGLYMPGPALATFVIQKFIYKEGFSQYGWTFDRKAMKWILFTPLFFIVLTILTFAIIGLLGNTHLIPEFGRVDLSQESLNLRIKEIAGSKLDITKIHTCPAYPHTFFSSWCSCRGS